MKCKICEGWEGCVGYIGKDGFFNLHYTGSNDFVGTESGLYKINLDKDCICQFCKKKKPEEDPQFELFS